MYASRFSVTVRLCSKLSTWLELTLPFGKQIYYAEYTRHRLMKQLYKQRTMQSMLLRSIFTSDSCMRKQYKLSTVFSFIFGREDLNSLDMIFVRCNTNASIATISDLPFNYARFFANSRKVFVGVVIVAHGNGGDGRGTEGIKEVK